MKCLMGECVVPQIELVPSSACAFIQYDGALLTIASNNSIFMQHENNKR